MSSESTRIAEVFKRWPRADLTITGQTEPVVHFEVTITPVNAEGKTVGTPVTATGTSRTAAIGAALAMLKPVRQHKPRAAKAPVEQPKEAEPTIPAWDDRPVPVVEVADDDIQSYAG